MEGPPDDRYENFNDPYVYKGTTVLKNIPGLRSQEALDRFETAQVLLRSLEPLPRGRFSVGHYKALHKHLFQDVYRWAGKYRKTRIVKGSSMFCYPEHIEREMKQLFSTLKQRRFLRGLRKDQFAFAAADFLATLNAIHPFREGNGRAQLIFLRLLADKAGHPLDLTQLDPESFLEAMIDSFDGDITYLADQISAMAE